MRQDICTIPVSEVFEVTDGCPFCRMHKTVEERIINFIMGDAMMESDVRIETNKHGFCPDHFEKMLAHNGRLQLSLMLNTHLAEISADCLASGVSPKTAAEKANDIVNSCFICDKIAWGEERMIATVYRLYEQEEDFRKLFNAQPHFCLPHFAKIMGGINKKTCRKHGKEMAEKLISATKDYCADLTEKLKNYSFMYDYRNAGNKDFGDSRFSVEDSINFLTMSQNSDLHKPTK